MERPRYPGRKDPADWTIKPQVDENPPQSNPDAPHVVTSKATNPHLEALRRGILLRQERTLVRQKKAFGQHPYQGYKARKATGLLNTEIAQEAGLPYTTLSRWINDWKAGDKRKPGANLSRKSEAGKGRARIERERQIKDLFGENAQQILRERALRETDAQIGASLMVNGQPLTADAICEIRKYLGIKSPRKKLSDADDLLQDPDMPAMLAGESFMDYYERTLAITKARLAEQRREQAEEQTRKKELKRIEEEREMDEIMKGPFGRR